MSPRRTCTIDSGTHSLRSGASPRWPVASEDAPSISSANSRDRSARFRYPSAIGSAEPPASASNASRPGRKRVRIQLNTSTTSPNRLPSWYKSGRVGATSKLAPVVRLYRTLYSGTTTANGSTPSPFRGRAREHRELNRRDNPRRRSKAGLKAPARSVDGKRKPGRAHTRGCGAQCRCGKAPPSRSDRSPQGEREQVGRGSLPSRSSSVGGLSMISSFTSTNSTSTPRRSRSSFGIVTCPRSPTFRLCSGIYSYLFSY